MNEKTRTCRPMAALVAALIAALGLPAAAADPAAQDVLTIPVLPVPSTEVGFVPPPVDAATLQCEVSRGMPLPLAAVAFSPDGKTLAVGAGVLDLDKIGGRAPVLGLQAQDPPGSPRLDLQWQRLHARRRRAIGAVGSRASLRANPALQDRLDAHRADAVLGVDQRNGRLKPDGVAGDALRRDVERADVPAQHSDEVRVRNGEADLRAADLCHGNADQRATAIQHGAARVARVEAAVDLDTHHVAVIVAAHARDAAQRYGGGRAALTGGQHLAEREAHDVNRQGLSHLELALEIQRRQEVLIADLEDRQIVGGVECHDFGRLGVFPLRPTVEYALDRRGRTPRRLDHWALVTIKPPVPLFSITNPEPMLNPVHWLTRM